MTQCEHVPKNNSHGTLSASPITVADGADDQNKSEITATDEGDFGVIWENDTDGELLSRTYDAAGVTEGGVKLVGTDLISDSLQAIDLADGRTLHDFGDEGNIESIILDPRDSINGPVYTPVQYQIGTVKSETISTAAAAEFVYGWEGNDTINSTIGFGGVIFAGAGNDTVNKIGIIQDKDVDGGDDTDKDTYLLLANGAVINLLLGTSEANGVTAAVTNFEDFEYAGPSDITVIGGSAANAILTGDGDDTLFGNSEGDFLQASLGNDRANGGSGDDTIRGGDGSDTLIGASGDDNMFGDDGDDTYFLQQAGDTVTEAFNEGTDTVFTYVDNTTAASHIEELHLVGPTARTAFSNSLDNQISGNGGSDTLSSATGNDTLVGNGGGDQLNGDDGNDRLLGSDGFDTLNGGADNDRLEGQGDLDILDGGAGNDTIFGGGGRDTMTGGDGSDRFVFASGDTADSVTQADRITDFDQAENDCLDLRSNDAVTGGGDDAFTFIGARAFSGTAGELRYQQAGGETRIFGDTDGDGAADFIVRLETNVNLGALDFLL
eukprot:XP_019922599.1 PREDICTED: uncharacterized protein LOC109618702 [Crassostrea gigas]